MTIEQQKILKRNIMQTVENELYDRILFDAPDHWPEAVLEEMECAVLTPIRRSVENLTAEELKDRNTAKAHVQTAAILTIAELRSRQSSKNRREIDRNEKGMVVGFALLLVFRWVVDAALLPNARIAEEIARDRNVNVGLLEGVLASGVAGIILMVF